MHRTMQNNSSSVSIYFIVQVLVARFILENFFLSLFIFIYSDLYWQYSKGGDEKLILIFEKSSEHKKKVLENSIFAAAVTSKRKGSMSPTLPSHANPYPAGNTGSSIADFSKLRSSLNGAFIQPEKLPLEKRLQAVTSAFRGFGLSRMRRNAQLDVGLSHTKTNSFLAHQVSISEHSNSPSNLGSPQLRSVLRKNLVIGSRTPGANEGQKAVAFRFHEKTPSQKNINPLMRETAKPFSRRNFTQC